MNYNNFYSNIIFILVSCTLIFCSGCKNKQTSENQNLTPKANVVVANIEKENMNDTLFFNSSTVFNNKTIVQSPIAGYLSTMKISNGMNVSKGDYLFEVVTKEYNALKSSPGLMDTLNISSQAGKIHILSPAFGQIADLIYRQGQFVTEGNALCTIIDLSSILFKLYVPLEYKSNIKNGMSCSILLPDGLVINGRVTSLLAKTEVNTQTETYYVKPSTSIKIPEGVNVRAFIVTSRKEEAQIVPRNAVLSNETLSEFWVMKIINDSTAIKTIVKPGKINGSDIEITEPDFNETDRIVVSGNYGLPDTAFVNISTEKEEK